MSETPTEEMLRYVRFDEAHAARVAALAPHLRPQFDQISRRFYERIREHEDANAVLRDEAQVLRLRGSLVAWLEGLLSGRYDEAHFANTERIGRVHVAVGLPQRYMPLAMALIRSELVARAVGELGAAAGEAIRSLDLLVDVELAVMMEGYRRHYDDRIRSASPSSATTDLATRRAAQAIEVANVIVVGADAGGRIVLFNGEAERVSGWARDECVGDHALERLFDEDTRRRIRPHVAGGTDLAFDAPLVTRAKKAREARWHLVRPAPGTDTDVAFFLVGHDVTDAVQLAERTQRSERLAAVGMLAAGLAHEIRNPLNGAQLHVTFLERSLKKGGSAPELLDAAETVGTELTRLSNLVTEFLQFARPQPLSRRLTSLAEVAQRVEAVLRPDAEAADVTLRLELPDTAVLVMADANKLEQVVLNLARNAIEAFPAEPRPASGTRGHVTIRVRRMPRQGVVDVEDDGAGLPDPGAPIFDAFYSTKPGGTGLGLPIAHRIVTDHEGSLSVESARGRTVFSAALPIAEAP